MISSFEKEILRVVLMLDEQYCGFETIRRELYGKPYPRWQLDALRINIVADSLIEKGMLTGGFMSGVQITRHGMEAIA